MTDLPRAHSRPGSLPLWAAIANGKMIGGPITFETGREHFDQEFPIESVQRDGTRYLPVFGSEPVVDLSTQYFLDSFTVESSRVVRHRIVCNREAP